MTPVYHALHSHLTVDRQYSITEPVAGIVKGTIESLKGLAYKPSITDIEAMLDVELNPIISEPDGTYFISQFAAYKKLSILKRLNVIKTIHHIKKYLPPRLKSLLQQKMTDYVLTVAKTIVNQFLESYSNEKSADYIFSTVSSTISYNRERSEMYINISVKPLGVIEYINVSLIVN
jgi:hypothetical protein